MWLNDERLTLLFTYNFYSLYVLNISSFNSIDNNRTIYIYIKCVKEQNINVFIKKLFLKTSYKQNIFTKTLWKNNHTFSSKFIIHCGKWML